MQKSSDIKERPRLTGGQTQILQRITTELSHYPIVPYHWAIPLSHTALPQSYPSIP